MEILMALCAGGLIAVGLYLMLRRNMFSMFIGLVILAHGVNLVLFTSGGLVRGEPPILSEEEGPERMADPLPQALILTAIVIGMGVQGFLLVLLYRLYAVTHTEDLDEARSTEPGTPREQP